MRPIVYIILLAVAALVFKAFFLDAYLAERKAAESNTTVQTPQAAAPKPEPVKTMPVKRIEDNLTDIRMTPNYKEAPLEKLGDTIAEKIEKKL